MASSAAGISLPSPRTTITFSIRLSGISAADRAAGQELLAKAGANLTVDLPEAMLDRTADNEMRMLEQRLSRSNITWKSTAEQPHHRCRPAGRLP